MFSKKSNKFDKRSKKPTQKVVRAATSESSDEQKSVPDFICKVYLNNRD